MAISLSKDSQIKIGSGALLVGQLTSWSVAESDTQIDVSNNDSTRREYINVGSVDGDISAEAHFDLADVGYDAVRSVFVSGAEATLRVYPDGDASGNIVLTGGIVVGASTVTAAGVEDVIVSAFNAKLISPFVESVIS